ncbi:hypothetical protein L1049_005549 [Liquidambar formosana]|uniref:Transmembrane protein n=1 Tax=Liquidambar formosana TaxID=63359 RepID=A0AAP0REN2_LIQFO
MDGAEVAEGFNEWEQIQSPSPQIPPSAAQPRGWDMVVIRDNYLHEDCSVFPPSHHEGLQYTPPDVQPHEETNLSSSSLLSEERSQSEEQSRVTGQIGRRLRLRFELLSSRIFRMASTVRSCVAFGGGFRSLPSVAGVLAALLLSVLYVRVQRWRRRRLREENKNSLILLIKEKDEKISRLLLQIAQMNDLLSTRHRVPVLRIN